MLAELSASEQALVALLEWLSNENYRFITPTPVTHQRLWSKRQGEEAKTLSDIFGWNLPFTDALLPTNIMSLLTQADILTTTDRLHRSTVRVSSIGNRLFLHSAFPTDGENAVFFGPDTYRFVNFVRQQLANDDAKNALRILDIGCGSGAGGLMAAQYCPQSILTLSDISPIALRYSAINSHSNAQAATLVLSDVMTETSTLFDLIIANPPYLHDDFSRLYRHGGDNLGRALSVRIASEALEHLAVDGRLLLYTGVAIVDGDDGFLAEMSALLESEDFDWHYEEIDPDVFSEELARPVYHQAERIAVVGLSVRKCRPYY
ncbi:MAG: methyltransferase [Agitococcus sp.]|nr:methyltransferase [Agitococcus sp.]